MTQHGKQDENRKGGEEEEARQCNGRTMCHFSVLTKKRTKKTRLHQETAERRREKSVKKCGEETLQCVDMSEKAIYCHAGFIFDPSSERSVPSLLMLE